MSGPKHLFTTHQTEARTGAPEKENNMAVFDHHDVRKYFVEINGVRYPRDAIDLDYSKNYYLNQNRDLKTFLRD